MVRKLYLFPDVLAYPRNLHQITLMALNTITKMSDLVLGRVKKKNVTEKNYPFVSAF